MRIQKEIENVERVKNRVATVPLTMEDAVEFHKQVVDRIEKDRKDINKELGIGDVEEDGFTGASKETKKVSTPELKKMKLSESLFESLNEALPTGKRVLQISMDVLLDRGISAGSVIEHIKENTGLDILGYDAEYDLTQEYNDSGWFDDSSNEALPESKRVLQISMDVLLDDTTPADSVVEQIKKATDLDILGYNAEYDLTQEYVNSGWFNESLTEAVDYETYVNNVVKKVSNEDLLNIYVRLSNSSDIFYTETKDYKDFHIAHEVILGRMDGLSDEEIIDKILSFKNESLNEGYFITDFNKLKRILKKIADNPDSIVTDPDYTTIDVINGKNCYCIYENGVEDHIIDSIVHKLENDFSTDVEVFDVETNSNNIDFNKLPDAAKEDLEEYGEEELNRNYYRCIALKNDINESLNEELEDTDGWGDEIEYILSESFSELENLMYEVRNCRRGSYTGCETAEELADYTHRLAEDLDECSYEIKANRNSINESFMEGGNTFTPVKTTILDKVDEGEDPLTYNEPWDEVQYINNLASEVEEELDLIVEADTGTIQFTAEAGTGDSVAIDYSDLNEEEYRILAESSSEEEFKNNYRSFLLDLFENPFNESLNEDGLILPPEVQAQKDKEEKERQEREKEAEFRRQTQREIERDEAREKAKEERDKQKKIKKEKEEKERQIKNQMWKEKDWVAEREKAGGFDKLNLDRYSQEEKDHLKKAFDEFDKDETAQARYKRDKEKKEREARREKISKGIKKAGELPGEVVNAAKKGLSKSGIHLNF